MLRANFSRRNKTQGVYVCSGAAGTIEGNVCESNGSAGIAVTDAGSAPALVGNTCRDNADQGIAFTEGAAGTARGNTCGGSGGAGILVADRGTHPVLQGNICVAGRTAGILFQDGAGGEARENVCEGNTLSGFLIIGPANALPARPEFKSALVCSTGPARRTPTRHPRGGVGTRSVLTVRRGRPPWVAQDRG